MTNWLIIFLALYALVGQPAIVWWMIDNTQLYELAWLNAWIFLIALIVSSICKPNKSNKDNSPKVVEKSEQRVSKIENDNGVSIVEVEKKTEVVVQSNEEKEESNIEEPEELEEQPEEKVPEKPMKETVSIPKIVQPLTWHQTPKRRKKNVRWWQRIVLLITLGIAVVVAWTLWEFLENRWIAIALFLWWILYLVIGKLFDIDGFYSAKKIFTNWLYVILILAWIGYGVYTMQNEDRSFNNILPGFTEKVTSYVKWWFERDENQSEENQEDNTSVDMWDIIYVYEWTWEVIENSGETENLDNIVEKNTSDIQPSESENVAEQQVVVEDKTSSLSSEEAKQKVKMGEAIKAILAWTTLSTKINSTFTYVSKTSELYPYFKTAQEKWMIWVNTNPDSYVSCETYITMKWLAEWWNVWSYASSEIKSVYWKKAAELWKLNGCEKWASVTKWNL